MAMGCPGTFDLARYQVGELAPEEIRAMAEHLERCARCSERLTTMEADRRDFDGQEAARFAALMARVHGGGGAKSRDRGRNGAARHRAIIALWAGGALAAVAAVLLVLPRRPVDEERRGGLFKGRFTQQVVAKRGERQFVVQHGQALREGDALRFVVSAANPGYLSIFSVDGRRKVTPFYPATDPDQKPEPLRIRAAGRVILPQSIILDDAVGSEHIVTVYSRRPFDRPEVHRRAWSVLGAGHPERLTARALRIKGTVLLLTIQKVAP